MSKKWNAKRILSPMHLPINSQNQFSLTRCKNSTVALLCQNGITVANSRSTQRFLHLWTQWNNFISSWFLTVILTPPFFMYYATSACKSMSKDFAQKFGSKSKSKGLHNVTISQIYSKIPNYRKSLYFAPM